MVNNVDKPDFVPLGLKKEQIIIKQTFRVTFKPDLKILALIF